MHSHFLKICIKLHWLAGCLPPHSLKTLVLYTSPMQWHYSFLNAKNHLITVSVIIAKFMSMHSITEKVEGLDLAVERLLEEAIKVKGSEGLCQGLVLKEDKLPSTLEYQSMALKMCKYV